MPINRLHHIGMSVPDIEAGMRFYRDVLGFEEMDVNGFENSAAVDAILGLTGASAKVTFLKRGDLWIEMFEFSSPKPDARGANEPVHQYGISHFCLDVTDVDALYAGCVAKGMRFHAPPVATHGFKTTYGRDPFGNVIELQEILDDAVAEKSGEATPA